MAPASQLSWYLHRLAAMSPGEVVHRIREQVRRSRFRGDRRGWKRFAQHDGPLVALAPLSSMLARKGAKSWPRDWRELARSLQAGELSLLGRDWPRGLVARGGPDLWFADPVSGEPWAGAGTYCFDIGYRRERQRGDVKYVWEANRLQFLQPLAILGRDDPALAELALEMLLDWMDANPPFRGINWASGIELALRLCTLAVVTAALGDRMTADQRARLRAFVAAHVFWLERYPSLYSSANNHRVSEGLGLLLAGLLAPDLRGAPRWRHHGQAILREAALSQFHPDGVGVEQSPTYAAFTLEMLSFAALVNSGELFDGHARARLSAAQQWLESLLDAGGRTPRIGDDDEGRVLWTPREERHHYVASVAAAAAGVLGGTSRQPCAFAPQLRNHLFPPPASVTGVPDGVHHFPQGGYTVARRRMGTHDTLVCFDHGPLGHLSIAAHGHADALAVWLHVDGQAVLADGGTGLYHAGDSRRDHMRSSLAHNTLTIAGESQSIPAGAFNWRSKAETRLLYQKDGDTWEVSARHDGYARRFGAHHGRRLRGAARGFIIEDALLGPVSTPLPVMLAFLVHPNIKITRHDDALLLAGLNFAVRLTPPDRARVAILHGNGSRPSLYSDGFGQTVLAQTILLEATMAPGEVLATVFTLED